MKQIYDFFIDECEFMKICLDIKRLRKTQEKGDTDPDLEDQYHELCTSGGECLTRTYLLNKK